MLLVGHAGDGNFHLVYLLDPAQPEELDEARRLNARMVAARARDGRHVHRRTRRRHTARCSLSIAEHGDGVDVMRDIKRALDPENRMNPGKVVDV